MKKNLYYRTVYRRLNFIKVLGLDFIPSVASWPRILLEVFIRKNFGERYYSTFTASLVLILCTWLPNMGFRFFSHRYRTFLHAVEDNWTWYLYLAAFVVMCFLRAREIYRSPSVFDFGRFSLSAGEIHPLFLNLRINGKKIDRRTIEIFLEPALFLFIGMFLWWLDQRIGVLLMGCSIMYSLSYMAAYHKGDMFVMDTIDEMICNQRLVEAFVEERDTSETCGVSYYGRKPADPETRRKVAKQFIEEEEDDVVVAR